MKLTPLRLAGALILEPRVFADERGFFLESWNRRALEAVGIAADFVQDNHSRSSRGTLRGLHYQNPNAQGKLVRVIAGAIFDVIVDLRAASPTFGQWEGIELSDDNKKMLWVPPGFAHGFLTLSNSADMTYKCSAYYAPADEHSLAWNDPALAIAWPDIGAAPRLSPKDAAGHSLADSRSYP